MNKEVTKKRIREILATVLSVLMLAGIFSCFSVFADNARIEESTSGAAEDNSEGSSTVILRADELVNKTYPSSNTAVELVERDGISVMDLTVSQKTNDTMVYLDVKGYRATRYVVVLARADICAGTNFSLYYHTSARGEEGKKLDEDARIASPYYFGNGWQFLEFDMKDEEGWGGSIYTFRMDYLEGGSYVLGTKCEIAAIIFSDDEQAISDAAFDLITEIYSPAQTLSNFKESDVAYFCYGNALNTKIDAIEGNLIYRYVDDGEPNDPQAMFDYLGYTEANGMQALTTDDFRYTVIRYSAPEIANSVMELFTLTGSAQSLMEMIRAEKYVCHSAHTSYSRAVTWSTMILDMAEDDGLEENTGLKYGWNREDGDKTFKGFRVDWCTKGIAGYYLEISDIMFYQDANAANGMAFALSSLTVGDDFYLDGDPEDPDKSDETIGEEILPPWATEETTAEETAEETVPEYDNPDEETTEYSSAEEETTEESDEETSEDDTEETSADDTEETSQEETFSEESEDESKPEVTINPDGIDSSDDEPKEKGSEVPFYIACGALAALSVASVVVVVVIRIKEKM